MHHVPASQPQTRFSMIEPAHRKHQVCCAITAAAAALRGGNCDLDGGSAAARALDIGQCLRPVRNAGSEHRLEASESDSQGDKWAAGA